MFENIKYEIVKYQGSVTINIKENQPEYIIEIWDTWGETWI